MEISNEQIQKAKEWFALHKDHINKITKEMITCYPPTDNEDKNNPSLWKASHWLWFLKTCI